MTTLELTAKARRLFNQTALPPETQTAVEDFITEVSQQLRLSRPNAIQYLAALIEA